MVVGVGDDVRRVRTWIGSAINDVRGRGFHGGVMIARIRCDGFHDMG